MDGSEYVHATQIHCPHCLHQRQANGETHYAQLVVGATVPRAGSHDTLPLAVEEVRNSKEPETQDCELMAANRGVKRVRAEHRQLSLCIVGDDLYGHAPLSVELPVLRMSFVLVAKPPRMGPGLPR